MEIVLTADDGVKFANPLTSATVNYKTAEVSAHAGSLETGIVLTAERAGKLFSEWHTTKELSDDELDSVAGGCGDDDDTPRACPKCGSTDLDSFIGDGGYIYLKCKKRFCEAVWKAGEK